MVWPVCGQSPDPATASSAQRYEVDKETVYDQRTGLGWAKMDALSSDPLNWTGALEFIRGMNAESVHGHTDWRLPNVRELESLIDVRRPSIHSFRYRKAAVLRPPAFMSRAMPGLFTCRMVPPAAAIKNRPIFRCGRCGAAFGLKIRGLTLLTDKAPVKLQLKRTAEYRISNRRMSRGGIALLSLFNKIDRIHYFDIRHSLFDIRYSLFHSFFY